MYVMWKYIFSRGGEGLAPPPHGLPVMRPVMYRNCRLRLSRWLRLHRLTFVLGEERDRECIIIHCSDNRIRKKRERKKENSTNTLVDIAVSSGTNILYLCEFNRDTQQNVGTSEKKKNARLHDDGKYTAERLLRILSEYEFFFFRRTRLTLRYRRLNSRVHFYLFRYKICLMLVVVTKYL